MIAVCESDDGFSACVCYCRGECHGIGFRARVCKADEFDSRGREAFSDLRGDQHRKCRDVSWTLVKKYLYRNVGMSGKIWRN